MLVIIGVASVCCWISSQDDTVNRWGLLATGRNTYGQLGDGTTTDKSTPVRISF